jgi:hypothetical protein
LANDAIGGAAAGKIAGVEFIDENGGGAGPAPKASVARTRLAAGAVDIRQKANIILR